MRALDPRTDDSMAALERLATAPAGKRFDGLGPVVGARTRLVVLGSFPGVASLRSQQYYGHPRNQFWPILGALWGIDLGHACYTERLEQARARGLGLWDVYASCEREGSLDRAIQRARGNDLASLTRWAPGLRAIAHNGAESARAMRQAGALGVSVHRLPSTSPAHAGWNFERKLSAWRAVFEVHGLA